jgi:hypothetical protein
MNAHCNQIDRLGKRFVRNGSATSPPSRRSDAPRLGAARRRAVAVQTSRSCLIDPQAQAAGAGKVRRAEAHVGRPPVVGQGCDDQFEFEFALDLLVTDSKDSGGRSPSIIGDDKKVATRSGRSSNRRIRNEVTRLSGCRVRGTTAVGDCRYAMCLEAAGLSDIQTCGHRLARPRQREACGG